jgi:hypothetical protein
MYYNKHVVVKVSRDIDNKNDNMWHTMVFVKTFLAINGKSSLKSLTLLLI